MCALFFLSFRTKTHLLGITRIPYVWKYVAKDDLDTETRLYRGRDNKLSSKMYRVKIGRGQFIVSAVSLYKGNIL